MPADTNDKTVPDFNNLPFRGGDPPYSAWGLWGEHDNIGTLVYVQLLNHYGLLADHRIQNWLSQEVVKNAASEIREGLRFSLK